MIVDDVLKYLEGENDTLTIIMVVGIQVTSFTVCEEEKIAPLGDEGAYMRWPHLPSLNNFKWHANFISLVTLISLSKSAEPASWI